MRARNSVLTDMKTCIFQEEEEHHGMSFPEDQELDSPPGFAFPELLQQDQQSSFLYSEMSSSTSTPFVSAPSSPSRMKGFYFSAPTSPTWSKFKSLTENSSNSCYYNNNNNNNYYNDHGSLDPPPPLQLDLQSFYPRRSFHGSSDHDLKPSWDDVQQITPLDDDDDDPAPSILLSGSSEFEFSARFSDTDDPPMSPTLISNSCSCFPLVTPFEHHHSTLLQQQPSLSTMPMPSRDISPRESLTFLSAPQSPYSFPCRISSHIQDRSISGLNDHGAAGIYVAHPQDPPTDVNFNSSDPNNHHRRNQSSSAPRVFDWNQWASKSNSSSGRCTFMDHGVKDNCHQSGAKPDVSISGKSSRKWSFKGFLHRKNAKDVDSTSRSSNSSSLRSSGRSSCSSFSAGGESDEVNADDNAKAGARGVRMDHRHRSVPRKDDSNAKARGHNEDGNGAFFRGHNPSMGIRSSTTPSGAAPSRRASLLSPSSSSSSTSSSTSTSSASVPPHLHEHVRNGSKLNAHKATRGPYAEHYTRQRAQTEELKKKTFLPYKQSLLGCLGISGKSYRAIATLSKPLQSIS